MNYVKFRDDLIDMPTRLGVLVL